MRALLVALLVVCACGNDNNNNTDAQNPPDAPPPPCDYTEANDATNNTAAEATNLTVGGVSKNLCGTIDPGHFDMASSVVDEDRYRVTVGADASLVVRFFGDAGVDALSLYSVLIFSTANPPALINGGNYNSALGDHGVFRTALPAGTYDVVVRGKAAAGIAAAVSYKVRIFVETPCATVTTAASYTEANDGADNHGNDVMTANFAADPSFALTASTTDSAETTGATIDATTPLRVSGSSASVSAGADQYLDRDTFEVMTGATTNELAIRLDWTAAVDLDYVVFADGATMATGASTTASTTPGEYATFAVKPSASYWIWVGAQKLSAGLPATYDLSMCGAAESQ